ncbi:MAG: NDP-hexose 2,3-dehydratase family protein [Eubacterium sp.]|nr:NDP-hexose 2,3-dehydratase family protein [Eubacterium sp.]
MSILFDILRSWNATESPLNSTDEIRAWIEERKAQTTVVIEKTAFPKGGFWYLDEETGYIRNQNGSFFQLAGYRKRVGDRITVEQPVILQQEIGYLGILCKKFDGLLHFLMQAKIEPGNINAVQLSPTIQATKSNFTRKHGGAAPAYLDWFREEGRGRILVDQVQSEQSSRFYQKRNRNMLLLLDESAEVEVLPTHVWMTLGQIKQLMHEDNAVNMDTRTVLSGISMDPALLSEEELAACEDFFSDKALYASLFKTPGDDRLHDLFHQINDHKMFDETTAELVPLTSLESWEITDREIVCKHPYDFRICYCDIEIEGREVRRWSQPLVEADGKLLLGLFTRVKDGCREFLVKVRPEIGCFDTAELGPSIQLEPSNPVSERDSVETFFLNRLEEGQGVLRDVVLSEEGGRFYHEENRNVILEIAPEELAEPPEGYTWTDYRTLNRMVQFSNVLNIQLRNLLAILDM